VFVEEVGFVLGKVFIESDMAFVYVDRINNLTIVHRDFYGKRSLIVQASIEENGVVLLFSSS
jgi:hypothetical protein